MRRVLLPLLLVAGAARPAEPYLDRDKTLGLVAHYENAKHWALKGMVLLSLGPRWHRDGARMVAKGLRDRDRRVRPFALEALRDTEEDALRRIASREVVAALVKAQNTTNRYFAGKVRDVLGKIAPAALARSTGEWTSWWQEHRDTYEPLPWREPEAKPKKKSRRTKAEPFLKRLFDLQNAGLELCICIDSTSSMQPAIDLARDAVLDVVEVLEAVAPAFRLGLVTYRDDEDLEGGARVLSKMTRRAAQVRGYLAALRAVGGGDAPERVEKGLELALDPRLGWRRAANKVVILVGDAPPKNLGAALALVRAAHTKPFGSKPVTGKGKREVRPFVVSAIAIGNAANSSFRRITAAGGGSVSRLSLGRAPKGVRRTSGVAKHILALAFGKRFEDQIGAFLRVFDRYKREKYLR